MQLIHTMLTRLVNSWNVPLPNSPSQSAKVCYEFFKERAEIYFDPKSVLRRACQSGNVLQASTLLSQLSLQPEEKTQLLFFAIGAMQFPIVKLLIENKTPPLDTATLTSLLSTLFENFTEEGRDNFEKITLLFIDKGANVSQNLFEKAINFKLSYFINGLINRNPSEAFIMACQAKNTSLAESILKQTTFEKTTLNHFFYHAVINFQPNIVELLMDKGAPFIGIRGDPTPLHDLVFKFFDNFKEGERDNFEKTALLLINKFYFSEDQFEQAINLKLNPVIEELIKRDPSEAFMMACRAKNASLAESILNQTTFEKTTLNHFFYHAVINFQPNIVELLMDKGAPFIGIRGDPTPLHDLVFKFFANFKEGERDNFEKTALLLINKFYFSEDQFEQAINLKLNPVIEELIKRDPSKAFMMACRINSASLAESILKQTTFEKTTLNHFFYHAVINFQPNIVELLMDKGAPFIGIRGDPTPLNDLVFKFFDNFKEGERDNFEKTILLIFNNSLYFSQSLLKKAIDLKLNAFIEELIKRNPSEAFMIACQAKNVSLAESILKQANFDPDILNQFLSHSIKNLEPISIKLLIEKLEEDLNCAPLNFDELIQLHFERLCVNQSNFLNNRNAFEEIALFLLEKGAKLDPYKIISASDHGFFSIIQTFARKNPQDPSVKEANKPIDITAALNSQADHFLPWLIRMCMGYMDEQDQNTGETALHVLLGPSLSSLLRRDKDRHAFLSVLTGLGANPDLPNHNGITPRLLAQNHIDPNIRSLFLLPSCES